MATRKKYKIVLSEKYVRKSENGKEWFQFPVNISGQLVAIQTIIPLDPYTEPDLDAVRKEAYEQGHKDGYNKHDTEKIRKRGYDKGLDDIGNALRLLLFQYSNYTLQEIFGYDTARAVVEHFEGREIVARIRCYEGGVKQDVETIRKEAYDKGYTDAAYNCHERCAFLDDAKKEAYQRGLSDAWEAARKVTQVRKYGGYGDCLGDVFGRTDTLWDVFDYSASEAIEKIRQYEQEKEEIKVGDEVINQNKTAVVTEITNRYTRIMYSDGSSYALFAKGLTKTGRHFPEIAAVLEKMKES